MTVISLLHDGALRLEVAPAVMPAASFWIPLLPRDTVAAPGAAVVCVRASAGVAEAPGAPATLHVQEVAAWLSGERASLAAASGLAGAVDLGAGRAELALPPADGGQGAADLASGLTMATALLLGRMGRALAHSAAVVGPGGRAWLLVGDSHAGKSTTSANLLQAGWRYVSDDQVVLYRAADGELRAEGWPRPFHLDEGWEGGAPLHRRGTTDPRERWPGRWTRTAPLAGLLFPRVEADRPTARARLPASDALARLLRQSPWLLADRGAAPRVLRLLQQVASLPAYELRLGLDTYADPARLVRVLA
ncbi:MAG TPA: hypothetical protein VGB24_11365 [Longimicrobium sp.]|uniref:hypothetical protein n=1 Tax=Longimicrobium sp. TaxID=2029185 RepID=UPI002ED8B98F